MIKGHRKNNATATNEDNRKYKHNYAGLKREYKGLQRNEKGTTLELIKINN